MTGKMASEQVSDVTLRENHWVIPATARQKYATSATQWQVVAFKP